MRALAQRPLDAALPQGRAVTVNLRESSLSWLFARGRISPRQFEAGERLRRDYERAGMRPSTTMRWDRAPGPRGRRRAAEPAEATLGAIAAKDRFLAAIGDAGPQLSDILWRVVCAGEGLADTERALGWPSRAAKLVLGIALDRLADHYRLP